MLLQAYDFAHLHRTMGVELQMGGADQWGNITAGLELIRRTSGAGEADATPSPAPRPRLQAAALAVGREVRQERGRRLGLARPGADVAVRVLPVLAQHRRPRRRDVPALVHRAVARGDRGARGGGGRARRRRGRRSARWRSTSRPGPTAPDAAARRDRGLRGDVLGATRSTIRRRCAALFESTGGFTFDAASPVAAGAAVVLAEAGRVRLAGRGAPDDRRLAA